MIDRGPRSYHGCGQWWERHGQHEQGQIREIERERERVRRGGEVKPPSPAVS